MYLMKQAGFWSNVRDRLKKKKPMHIPDSKKGGAANMLKEKAQKAGKAVGKAVKENLGEASTARIKEQQKQKRKEFKEKAVKHLGTAAKAGAGLAATGAVAAGAKKVYDDHLETQRRGAENKREARKMLFGQRKKASLMLKESMTAKQYVVGAGTLALAGTGAAAYAGKKLHDKYKKKKDEATK